MANLLRQPGHAGLVEILAFCALTLVAAFLFLTGPPAIAGGTSDAAKLVVQAVETRYHTAKTLKAVFLERYSEGRQQVRVESGTAYFSRPGRMRWEYEEPEKKLMQPLLGGAPVQLTHFDSEPAVVAAYAWSRDGKKFAITRARYNDTDVVMFSGFR